MRHLLLVLVILSLALFTGCKEEPTATEMAVAELEQKFEGLEVETSGRTMKLKVKSDLIFTTPYLEFFGQPEFWENTYDVGFAECSNRCGKLSVARREACEATPRIPNCSEASLVDASQTCQIECAKHHEIPITP